MSPSPCVLLIDDDPLVEITIQDSLLQHGIALQSRSDGRSGIAAARQQRPDAILLDLLMPDLNGFAVCSQLKAEPSLATIPVLFLPSSEDLSDKREGFRLGASDYLVKPIDEEELIIRITAHLNQAQLVRTLEQRLDLYQQHFGPLKPPSTGEAPTLPMHRIKRLERVKQLLTNDLQKPPTLEEIANVVHVTPKTINSDFKAVHNTTPVAWLKEYRLQHAAKQLRSSSTRITAIAHYTGFNSPANFSTAFKQRFQLTPRQYRETLGVDLLP